jgi:hypothetical protein
MMCRCGRNVKPARVISGQNVTAMQGHVNILWAKIFWSSICETICYEVGAAWGSGVL